VRASPWRPSGGRARPSPHVLYDPNGPPPYRYLCELAPGDLLEGEHALLLMYRMTLTDPPPYRYLCELAGTAPGDLLEEEQALLVMLSSEPHDVKDILTTNRGSR
jgi:hypothetical protein